MGGGGGGGGGGSGRGTRLIALVYPIIVYNSY